MSRRLSAWVRPGDRLHGPCEGAGCTGCGGFGTAPADPDAPLAPRGAACAACGGPSREGDPVLQDGPHNHHRIHRSHAIEAREREASQEGRP